MPFEIVRNDITNMCVDAIVNTANPKPMVGGGADGAIHKKAGPKLLKARLGIGNIAVGSAHITPAFELDARYVIHTAGPVWRGGLFGEAKQLRKCYDACLSLAAERNCASIAFPLICAGTYGFPRDKALQIAINAISAFLMEHEMTVYLVVYDRASFQLSEKLFHHVASYIDEHYVEERTDDDRCQSERLLRQAAMPCPEDCDFAPLMAERAPRPVPQAPMVATATVPKLDDLLAKTDAGFSETLLKLIDQTGKNDSAIYNRANVSRQHFSKIRNNPDYKPTKATALAFAIALELDLEQTKDLIGRAGYALTRSSKFDVIIMYFIEQKKYDLFEINATLFEFDQRLLGT